MGIEQGMRKLERQNARNSVNKRLFQTLFGHFSMKEDLQYCNLIEFVSSTERMPKTNLKIHIAKNIIQAIKNYVY